MESVDRSDSYPACNLSIKIQSLIKLSWQMNDFEVENSCRTCTKTCCPLRSIFEQAVDGISFAKIIVRFVYIFSHIYFDNFLILGNSEL